MQIKPNNKTGFAIVIFSLSIPAIINKVAILDLLEKLDDKEKQVILLRYYRGKTQNEVSKIMNVNQVQVSRIERRALEIMRRRLGSDAIIA